MASKAKGKAASKSVAVNPNISQTNASRLLAILEKNEALAFGLLLISSFVFVIVYYLTPLTTNDIWIQFKVGELIRATGEIPRTIQFAFSEAKDFPFVAHEWVPSVFYSFVYDYLGYNGMVTLKGIFGCLLLSLAALLSYQICKNKFLSFIIATFAMLILNFRSYERPEMFAYVSFLIEMNLYYAFRRTGNWKFIWFLVPVHFIWVNSHGSFLVSVGLPILFGGSMWAEALLKKIMPPALAKMVLRGDAPAKQDPYFLLRISMWTILLLALSFANPFGWHLMEHVYELSQSEYIQRSIFEWESPFSASVMSTRIFTVYEMLMAGDIFFVLPMLSFLSLDSFLLMAICFMLSLKAQRHIAIFALANIPSFAFAAKGYLSTKLLKRRWDVWAAYAWTLLLWGAIAFDFQSGNVVSMKPGFYRSARIDEKTLEYIRTHDLNGPVLNAYTFGGQLIYNFYPKLKIFIDSRVDAYGEKYMQFYMNIWGQPYDVFSSYLDKNHVNNIIIDYPLINIMKKAGNLDLLLKSGWVIAHQTPQAIVMTRS